MARLRWPIIAAMLCLAPASAAVRAEIASDPCEIVTQRYEAMIAEAKLAEANLARRIAARRMPAAGKQSALAANSDYYNSVIARFRVTYPSDLARCRKRLVAMPAPPAPTDPEPGRRSRWANPPAQAPAGQDIGPGFSDLPPQPDRQ